MDTTATGLISRLTAWAAAPFTTTLDIWDVVLTTILVTTVAVIWYQVMRHVQTVDL